MLEITKTEKIKRFLSYFGNLENIEISSGPMAYGIEELELRNKTSEAYFLGDIANAKKGRVPRHTKDDIIFQKKYFYVDFDVRQGRLEKTGECLSDEKMLEIELKMREAINEIQILNDWTFIVFTGNGFHYHRISNEPLKINKDTYRKAMEFILETIRGKFAEKNIDVKVDSAPKNIARLARLPYTINHARVKKYGEHGIKEGESYVLASRKEVRTELLGIFQSLADLYGDDVEVQEYKPKKDFHSGSSCTIEEINNIPIEDLIYKYCGVSLNKNGKDFISPKHGGPVGMYKKGNCVAWSGTHWINEPMQPAKGYNPYTFIKEHFCNGDDAKTFDWFRDNYSHIREIDDKNRQGYLEQKKEEDMEKYKKDVAISSNIEISDDEIQNDRNNNLEKIMDVKDIYRNGIMAEFMVDELNEGIGKIHLGTMNIIVGAPNAGKTTFCYLMLNHNLKKGLKVGFLSYEMEFRDIVEQYYFRSIGAMNRFMDASITDEDNRNTNEYKEKLVNNKGFMYYEDLEATLDSLKSHIEKMHKFGAQVVFIDNLIKIRRTENEFMDNTKVIEYLYRASKNMGIAIILMHHTDKQAAIKNLISFRGTGDVQIKPDNLFYIKRPGLNMEKNELSSDDKAELQVRKVKQRLGQAKLEEVSVYFFKGQYYSIDEYSQLVRNF